MAYIGKEPQVGNYIKLDAISTSSTNTYNLTKDSVAFTPESALHMLVSLNGVIQSPLSSFSVSGSTITFLPSSGTLSSSDTIDFILVLGNVLDIGTPSDSTVTNAKTNFVSSSSSAGLQIKGDGTNDGTSGTLQLNCSANTHGIKLASPAHTHGQNYTLTFPTTAPSADKALITDGSGNLSFGDGATYVPLLNVDNISNVSSYHVNNTYINSTYDYYFVSAFFKPATDGVTLYQRLYISASQDNGALTQGGVAPNSWEYAQIGGTNQSGGDNTTAGATLHFTTIGNGTGEGIHFHNHYYANNEKANTIYWHGQSSHHATNGGHVGSVTSGASGIPASLYQYSLVGMDFYFSSSSNISTGRINVYGVKGYV